MIRDFELFCNLNRIKTSDISLAEKTIDSFKASDAVCPSCGSKHCCSDHSHYDRDMITIKNNSAYVNVLSVLRVICSSCGHTHAIIPAGLIPYASYSLLFILTVLQSYHLRIMTVAALCDLYQISISTLYRWIELLEIHKALWLGVLVSMQTSLLTFLTSIYNKHRFLRDFFLLTQISFLQCHRKTTRYTPP